MAWEPQIEVSHWGRLQVVIEDTDVTFYRDVPVQIESWSSGDPFGDATAVLRFPQISPYDILGVRDLSWLRGHGRVDINLIRPDGSKKTLWEGLIASIENETTEDRTAISIQCIGALYQLDYYVRGPMMLAVSQARLYERAIQDEFHHGRSGRIHLRTKNLRIEYPDDIDPDEGTGWLTRYSGSWDTVLTGYVQRLLADMQHEDGRKWTVTKVPGRRPVLKVRDERTVSWTVTAGQPGVTHDLSSDFTQAPNVIFGEGVDESGTTWRNAVVDVVGTDETKTTVYPIGWHERVHPADRDTDPDGQPSSSPPSAYSDLQTRVEIHQKYGAGVALVDARRSARRQINREAHPGWMGRITLKSDPEEGSRFEIQAGENLRLRHFGSFTPPFWECYEALKDVGVFNQEDSAGDMNRGQFATVLTRTLDYSNYPPPSWNGTSTGFSDVPAGHPHAESIYRLHAAGLAMGFEDGTFQPDEDITRAQMASFIWRSVEWALDEELPEPSYDHFYDDDGSVHEYNINKAAENYLIFGYTFGVYGPDDTLTRRQAAITMQRLNRTLGGTLIAEKEGVILHIAQVEQNPDSGTVDLVVDTKARDLLSLSQMIERNKQDMDPAKMLMVNRESGQTDDTKFPWDYEAGSGSLPKESMAAKYSGSLPRGTPNNNPSWFVYVNGNNSDPYNRWAVVPLVVSGKGSIDRSEIRAFSANGQRLAIPFHVGVYQQFVTAYDMVRPGSQTPFQEFALVPDPDAEFDDAMVGWHPSAAVLWGQFGQRAGYWPGLESEGRSPTGVMIDEGTWQYQIQEAVGQSNVLWVAIYCETNAYFQGRFHHGVQ